MTLKISINVCTAPRSIYTYAEEMIIGDPP